jgi:hypothetical protein
MYFIFANNPIICIQCTYLIFFVLSLTAQVYKILLINEKKVTNLISQQKIEIMRNFRKIMYIIDFTTTFLSVDFTTTFLL